MARRRDTPWTLWLGFLAAALLFNGVILVQGANAFARSLREPVEEPEPEQDLISFDMVDERESEGEFIEQLQPNQREPVESERIAEQDSSVDKETRAPNQREQEGAKPSEQGDKGARPAKQDPERPKQNRTRDNSKANEGGEDGEGVKDGDDNLVENENDGTESKRGGGEQGEEGPPDPQHALLAGSPGMLQDTFGAVGNHDVLRDVDEGVNNVLDSKKHKFASFFNRIRGRVADQWRPQKVHDRYDPDRSKFGDKQRTTVLMVRLDRKGAVVKIVVEKRSGARHLDDEAIRAMRAAAPFPNPPQGLADARTGYIDFRFGFILDFNGSTRIFRYSK